MTDTTDPFAGAAVPQSDGRHNRRDLNRQRLIGAGLAAIANGHWRLTVKKLSYDAGISQRTFFYHFPTLDLYLESLIEEHGPTLLDHITKHDLVRLVMLGRP